MGKLREQMKGDLELKGLSPNTQEIYLRQVSQFSHGSSSISFQTISLLYYPSS
jgi:hypothetical protein